ncbi:hypothetical protein ARMGADRAFT_1029915 [Armillaria gallica]|uniref:Uncharacterized protein n=1 Tax=Armillaria gallica TaxID=47427 RepID=A0A2H3DFU6_ARMGA|nr:hypothetical protein ARMGADRAFT_1029915 [Armillaria gallica]
MTIGPIQACLPRYFRSPLRATTHDTKTEGVEMAIPFMKDPEADRTSKDFGEARLEKDEAELNGCRHVLMPTNIMGAGDLFIDEGTVAVTVNVGGQITKERARRESYHDRLPNTEKFLHGQRGNGKVGEYYSQRPLGANNIRNRVKETVFSSLSPIATNLRHRIRFGARRKGGDTSKAPVTAVEEETRLCLRNFVAGSVWSSGHGWQCNFILQYFWSEKLWK